MDKNKYYIQLSEKHWIHPTPIKKLINPILRKIQWYTNKPFVIASKTKWKNNKPFFIKYSFQRAMYEK